jgi:hypothetical protein
MPVSWHLADSLGTVGEQLLSFAEADILAFQPVLG